MIESIPYIAGSIAIIAFIYKAINTIASNYKYYKREDIYKGIWYTYNESKDDKGTILTGYELRFVRKWLLGKTICEISSLTHEFIQYKANVEIEGEYIYLYCKSLHKGERVLLILKPVFPLETTKQLKGASLGISYKGSIIASSHYAYRSRQSFSNRNEFMEF